MSASVGGLALFVGQRVLDAADRKAQGPIDLSHPLGVASGQIIIDRDDVNALAFQGVEVGRKCCDQRLSFTGLHLGDLPLVQENSADELDIEVAHVQGALGDFPDGCKCFGKNLIQSLPVGKPLPEFRSQLRQLDIREARHLRFQLVDSLDDRGDLLQIPLVLAADDFGENRAEHWRMSPDGYKLM